MVTIVIKKQAPPVTARVIQLLHFVIKNLLHTINGHGCKKNTNLQFDHSLTDQTEAN